MYEITTFKDSYFTVPVQAMNFCFIATYSILITSDE